MGIVNFRRRLRAKRSRKRRAAPLLPERMNLSGPARRVNRLVAAVALFGAFGTVALAVALTPGAPPSATSARASQGVLEISRIEVPAETVVEVSPATTVVMASRERAVKSDRLSPTPWALRTPRAPQGPRAPRTFQAIPADELPDARTLRGPVRDEAGETEIVMAPDRAPDRPANPGAAATQSGPEIEFGLSEPAAPDDRSAEAFEEAVEAAIEEAKAEADTEAVTEDDEVAGDETDDQAVAATHTAPVTTDVNMRAGPDNGAAVILVVPRRSEVEVIGCRYWCEVVYAGKRGWIYKGFVRGAES
jgi:hypothetical protein